MHGSVETHTTSNYNVSEWERRDTYHSLHGEVPAVRGVTVFLPCDDRGTSGLYGRADDTLVTLHHG